MLGSEAVLDGHHRRVRAVRELASDVVHQPDAPDAMATAVEVDDEPLGRAVVLVDAHRDAFDGVVGHACDGACRRCSDGSASEREHLG